MHATLSCAARALTRSEKLFESITMRKPRSCARATQSRCSCASSVSRKPSRVLSRSTIEPANAGRFELLVRNVVKPRREAIGAEHTALRCTGYPRYPRACPHGLHPPARCEPAASTVLRG